MSKGKPKLRDYGLKGIDSRPTPDFDAAPITYEEMKQAEREMFEYYVGLIRSRKFRRDLDEWDWNQGNIR
jgi:hypothetical protein